MKCPVQQTAGHGFVGLVIETLKSGPLLLFADDALEFKVRTDLPRGQDRRRNENRSV